MSRHNILSLSVLTAFSLAVLPGITLAQQKSLDEQLVGTWTLVSNDNVAPDGTKRQIFGANPSGILIFQADGRYAQIFVRPGPSEIQNRQSVARHTRGNQGGL